MYEQTTIKAMPDLRMCRNCNTEHSHAAVQQQYGKSSGTALGNYCSEECYWEWLNKKLAEPKAEIIRLKEVPQEVVNVVS